MRLTAAPATPPPLPEPVFVRVVGLPERVTETKVTTNAAGEIVSAVQVEKDAAAV